MSSPFEQVHADVKRPSAHAQLLARRLNSKSSSAVDKKSGPDGSKFASPTDQLMSPCTQKLRDNKGLLYKKAKPLSLQGRFAQAAVVSADGSTAKSADQHADLNVMDKENLSS